MLSNVNNLKGPKGLPILGNLFNIEYERLHVQLEDWANEYGPVYNLNLGVSNLIIVSDAKINQGLLKARPESFKRMEKMRKVLSDQGIDGVFNTEGEEWELHRQMVAKGLDVKHQKEFFPYMLKITERLLNRWNGFDNAFNVQSDFKRYTLDVTTHLTFGYDLNSIEDKGGALNSHMEKVFPMIAKRTNAHIPLYKIIKTKQDKAYEFALSELNDFADDIIAKTRLKLQNNPEFKQHPKNFLEAIIVASENEKKFTNRAIRSNLITLLFGGEDTTAHALTWAVYLLSQNPEVVKLMRNEAEKVIGNDKILQSHTSLSELKYTDAVIKEILRVKPIAPILLHQAIKDVEIEGYLFPKGARVVSHFRKACNNENNFSEPLKLMPERWLNINACPHHKGDASMPFGAGSRYCPGATLATNELKIVLSMLVHNFDFEIVEDEGEVKEVMAFTMITSPFKVKLKPRVKVKEKISQCPYHEALKA